MIAAVLDASVHRRHGQSQKVAEIIADKSYVNCPVDVIDQRLEGHYDNGIGRVWNDPDYMKFYNDGAANFPYLSDGMWFLTQHKRWGAEGRSGLPRRCTEGEPDRPVQAGRGARQGAGAEGSVSHVQDDRRHRVGWQESESLRRRIQDKGRKRRRGVMSAAGVHT